MTDAPTEAPPATEAVERLARYIEVWWQGIDELTRVLEELADDDWSTPTALPGWDVHAVAAHTAHIEAVCAGAEEHPIDFDPPPHVTNRIALYTESGVVARRDHTPDELINEILHSATARRTALIESPPTDPTGAPPATPGGIGWDWERLLRNRALDVWMHEQDVRRAVGLPLSLDTAGAEHAVETLSGSLGYVVGQLLGAAGAGTSVVLEIDGGPTRAAAVGDDGHGQLLDVVPDEPTTRVATDRETFVLTAAGRIDADPERWRIAGDEELGRRVVAALHGLTP